MFGCRKGKSALFTGIPSFWQNFLKIGTKEASFVFIVDQDCSDSRLPWLVMVVICLDGIGLKGVSWAVRYLDKPRWRAVIRSCWNKLK